MNQYRKELTETEENKLKQDLKSSSERRCAGSIPALFSPLATLPLQQLAFVPRNGLVRAAIREMRD